jgi:pyrimidine operon attenuation protein/uracil phosphoribosyltransferase
VKTKIIMDAAAMDRALTRIAHEIVERNPQADDLAFIGVRTHGASLAVRLAGKVGQLLERDLPVGEVDIAMHRDDLDLRSSPPRVGPSHVTFDVTDRTVVLVDDVLFTGRTVRAAMDEISDFGRPRRIQLAILVDRGHRELPIRPDFIGRNVPTAIEQRVRVHTVEVEGTDEVILEKQEG